MPNPVEAVGNPPPLEPCQFLLRSPLHPSPAAGGGRSQRASANLVSSRSYRGAEIDFCPESTNICSLSVPVCFCSSLHSTPFRVLPAFPIFTGAILLARGRKHWHGGGGKKGCEIINCLHNRAIKRLTSWLVLPLEIQREGPLFRMLRAGYDALGWKL